MKQIKFSNSKLVVSLILCLFSFPTFSAEKSEKIVCLEAAQKHTVKVPEPEVFYGGSNPMWISIYKIKDQDVCSVSFETYSPVVDCSDGARVITMNLHGCKSVKRA